MRRTLVALVALGAGAMLVTPAVAGDAIPSKAKIVGVYDEAHDNVSVYGQIKTKAPCYDPKRKFTLSDQDGKIETHTGYSDAFFKTDEVAIGDTLQLKVSSATTETDSGDKVKCKGSKSKDFEVTEIMDGGG
jgi:hypothetical protein